MQVGAADYIALAKNYHTVFISDIPLMSMENRDKVPLLIFNTRCKNCVCSAYKTHIIQYDAKHVLWLGKT